MSDVGALIPAAYGGADARAASREATPGDLAPTQPGTMVSNCVLRIAMKRLQDSGAASLIQIKASAGRPGAGSGSISKVKEAEP